MRIFICYRVYPNNPKLTKLLVEPYYREFIKVGYEVYCHLYDQNTSFLETLEQLSKCDIVVVMNRFGTPNDFSPSQLLEIGFAKAKNIPIILCAAVNYSSFTASSSLAEMVIMRSEERRVGKECRYRWSMY